MKRVFSLPPAVLIASFLTAPVAIAHHSFSMFDRSVEKVLTGTVVRWAFNNPHSWLYVNVKNKDGSETLWSFEGSSPTSLLQRGVTGRTFEPGNTVTVLYCPLKDGRPGGGLGWARLADGTFVNPADGGCNGSAEAIERWKVWLAKGYTSSVEAQNARQLDAGLTRTDASNRVFAGHAPENFVLEGRDVDITMYYMTRATAASLQ